MPMPIFLRDLGRNLAWGWRIPFGLPVTRLDFRIGVPQLLALFAFSALIDIGVDWCSATRTQYSRCRAWSARCSLAGS
jgi:hypothetical protein